MLTRFPNEAPARPYKGIDFKSKLEVSFAQFFDSIGLLWRYEVRPDEVRDYVPDFKLWDTPNLDRRIAAALPGWVEVKPMEMIYQLRDLLNIEDVFPEEETRSSQVSASDLFRMDIEEFWKPKKLAEATRIAVLVAGEVNCVRKLSALMLPDGILWQRNHPLVNWRGVQQKQRRAEEQARREAEWAEQRRQWQAERDAQAEREREVFRSTIRTCPEQPARYDGTCNMCRRRLEAGDLTLFREDTGGYRILCVSCIASLDY